MACRRGGSGLLQSQRKYEEVTPTRLIEKSGCSGIFESQLLYRFRADIPSTTMRTRLVISHARRVANSSRTFVY